MFFLRVKAVYMNSKVIVTFFGLLWLSVLGTLFELFKVTPGHDGTTKKCIIVSVNVALVVPIFLHTTFDTLVFIAISLRIASYSMVGDNFRTRLKSLFRGQGLPRLSRCIILGGQLYYLFVVFINFVVDFH
jgi:hypothetical protein